MPTAKKKTRKASPPRRPATKKASAKERPTTSKKTPPKKKSTAAKKATAKKKSTSKKRSSKKSTKTTARKTSKKTPASSAAKKRTSKKPKASARRAAPKKYPGASSALLSRASECSTLDECHGAIAELTKAAKAGRQWVDQVYDRLRNAEDSASAYVEWAAELMRAVEQDQATIAELERKLKANSRSKMPTANKAVLQRLDALAQDLAELRQDMRRLAKPSRAHRAVATAPERSQPAAKRPQSRRRGQKSTPPRASKNQQAPGPFAQYAVLPAAGCTLGVIKHGYDPEVCGPPFFTPEEAASILGKASRGNVADLVHWATLTGHPLHKPQSTPSPRKKAPTPKKPGKKAVSKKPAGRKGGRKKVPTSKTNRRPQEIVNELLASLHR
ncbi:MAG: hypothetical protein AAF799_15055 [Myxococcota bacterium]